jgi:hypothetical protein
VFADSIVTLSYELGEVCDENAFTATAHVSELPTNVSNMYLVVDTDSGAVQTANIPTNGSGVSLSVGPFAENTTVYYRVFGGGERNYDITSWNGYGGPTFTSDITTYGTANGYAWVTAGTDDPTPFVTWRSVEVGACPRLQPRSIPTLSAMGLLGLG